MAAPKGNQFWKVRTSVGRNKIFESPEILWKAACEYFEWTDEHPLIQIDVGKAGEHFGQQIEIPHQRPYTLGGLAIFLGCDIRTLTNYSTDKKYKDFFPIMDQIREIIYKQKFEGAAAGLFQPMIIARDLGLREKTELTGADGSPVMSNTQSTDEQAAANRERLLAISRQGQS